MTDSLFKVFGAGEVYKYFSSGVYKYFFGVYKYFSGVYKYFSGAGEVHKYFSGMVYINTSPALEKCLNTTMAFFCPGKVLDKCRSIYKYFSGFSGAGEVYKYFSGTVYINTSPSSRTP